MSKKQKGLLFGGAAVLLALAVAVMTWRRGAGLPVHAAAVDDLQSSTDPRTRRYVGAYSVPLLADANAAASNSSRIGEILTSGVSAAAKAQALLALFPQLPAAAQPAAAHHIVNLLPDNTYASFATQLTNAAAAPEVRAVIYADLLQRPNAIKLPWLLAIARSPGSNQASEAAKLLQATLREDQGDNWNAWSERIQVWLQAHPDDALTKGGN